MKENNINSVFDITKLLLSLMVVCIHCQILPELLFPWLRIAVPLFFVMSSYFLFKKISKEFDNKEKNKILKLYIQRNLKLYLFYAILLSPIIIYHRNYFWDGNFIKGLFRVLRSIVFSSTFIASWYIMASIIGTIIIYNSSKYLNNKIILLLSLIIYCIVTLRSSYMYLFYNNVIINNLINSYEKIFTVPFNSFPVSLIWIAIGKVIAENKIKYKIIYTFLIPIFALTLFIEFNIIKINSQILTNDCYFSLVPLCFLIFIFILNIEPFTIKDSIAIRNMSTVIYALHGTLNAAIGFILSKIGITNNYITFILTLLMCYIFYNLIIKLEKYDKLNWIKYAH